MNAIAWLIVICEAAFWAAVIFGLAARYIFRRQKLGMFFFALIPILDAVLFLAAAADLYRGAAATMAHAVAAVYIGVSVAFGKSMIQWADERFRYYVVKEGAKPVKRYGLDYAKHYAKGWGRHVLAFVIGGVLLAGTVFLIQDASRTEALSGLLKGWSVVLCIDFLIMASFFVMPKKRKNSREL
ncbi:hypothetical protein ABEY01_12215 [Bacillus velezensis]|uniref:Integral inner membrane protein n=1 Tax=Bacillus velezensis TaxID=492670 RepID=A0A7S9EQY8_BACVE|nr:MULTISPECIES: hypothetical protein [Bacillus]AOU00403.1 hypothetical protein A2I97_04680 [Bacillus velezensis]APH47280.1 hypothetical protein BSF20_02030 [Bacillus amyloliquefaciens]AQS43347.1 hypothetical protein BVH55_05335 [Bacillus velezensis]ASZ02882.1 hypothetical protein CJP14_02915 [Bacillus velezensis]AXT11758.1 hypothetical protein D0U03_04810 [Bacillus velezensis]